MNIDAIYDHGKLSFLTPVRLKHEKLRVTITVPDEEIELNGDLYTLPQEVVASARAMREKLDAILNAPIPPDDELPDLTQKQLDRIAAFELREDR